MGAFLTLFTILVSSPTVHSQSTDVAASDFDGSGRVDFVDFLDFSGAFGKTSEQDGFDAKFDLDGSATVDFSDFLIFANNFGKSTTEESVTLLYVSDIVQNRVEAVDISTNLSIPSRAFSVSFPRGLTLGPQAGLVYVANLDSLQAYDENGSFAFGIKLTEVENPVTGTPAAPSGVKVRVNAAETLAFVTETAAGAVEVIDLNTRTSLGQVAVGFDPGGMILSPDESTLYVGLRSDHIAVVDVATRTKVESMFSGTSAINKSTLSTDGATLYTATATPDEGHASGSLIQIVAIDVASRAVVDSLQISDPVDLVDQVLELATNPVGGSLLVTLFKTAPAAEGSLNFATFVGDLLVISLPNLELANTITIGEQAAGFGISPDGTTAFVSGSEELTSGVFRIFVVDLESGTRLSQLPIVIQSATEFIFQSTKQVIDQLSRLANILIAL